MQHALLRSKPLVIRLHAAAALLAALQLRGAAISDRRSQQNLLHNSKSSGRRGSGCRRRRGSSCKLPATIKISDFCRHARVDEKMRMSAGDDQRDIATIAAIDRDHKIARRGEQLNAAASDAERQCDAADRGQHDEIADEQHDAA